MNFKYGLFVIIVIVIAIWPIKVLGNNRTVTILKIFESILKLRSTRALSSYWSYLIARDKANLK